MNKREEKFCHIDSVRDEMTVLRGCCTWWTVEDQKQKMYIHYVYCPQTVW